MPDSIRAKFRVHTVTKDESSNLERVDAYAVTDDGIEENQKFHQASPSGHFVIVVSNPQAQGFFQMNKSYYFDITNAPD